MQAHPVRSLLLTLPRITTKPVPPQFHHSGIVLTKSPALEGREGPSSQGALYASIPRLFEKPENWKHFHEPWPVLAQGMGRVCEADPSKRRRHMNLPADSIHISVRFCWWQVWLDFTGSSLRTVGRVVLVGPVETVEFAAAIPRKGLRVKEAIISFALFGGEFCQVIRCLGISVAAGAVWQASGQKQ